LLELELSQSLSLLHTFTLHSTLVSRTFDNLLKYKAFASRDGWAVTDCYTVFELQF
jgi:hypothetical protein